VVTPDHLYPVLLSGYLSPMSSARCSLILCGETYASGARAVPQCATAGFKDQPLAAGAIARGIGLSSAVSQGSKPKYTLNEKETERLQKADPKEFPVIAALLNKPIPVNAKDRQGNTLLFYMASAGDAPRVKYLLSKGADPQCKNANGCTPLSCAKAKGHREVVSLLEKASAK
jgi:hypothetical protein